MNWKLCIPDSQRRALKLCRGSMDEGDGWGCGYGGYGYGYGGYGYGYGCRDGDGYGIGYGGYGWGDGHDMFYGDGNGTGRSATVW